MNTTILRNKNLRKASIVIRIYYTTTHEMMSIYTNLKPTLLALPYVYLLNASYIVITKRNFVLRTYSISTYVVENIAY